jgi:uncharacterized DUF497 family protein
MRFDWDEDKNRINTAKHGVSFELASLVFEDPFLKTVPDSFEEEARWRTFGMVEGSVIVLVVIHTWIEEDVQVHEEGEEGREEVVRIISARRATRQERESYEESFTEDY